MGIFGRTKPTNEMSDRELTHELKHRMRPGESIGERANKIKEADRRGLAWKDSDLNYKKK